MRGWKRMETRKADGEPQSADVEERASERHPPKPKPFGGCLVSSRASVPCQPSPFVSLPSLLNGKPACTDRPLLLTGLNARLHHSRIAGCTFSGSSCCCSCSLISNPGFTALALADQRPFANFVSIKPAPSRNTYIACSSSSEHLIHTLFHSYTI